MKQIWAKELRDEMNICLCFKKDFLVEENMVLKLSSCVPFRISINNEFFGYGPRRMAHTHAAINEYSLDKYIGQEICVFIECVCYRVPNFYIVNQVPFFASEITKDNKVIFDSFDFEAYRNYSRVQKVQRFGYQRGFTEVYDIDKTLNLEKVEVDEFASCSLDKCYAPLPKFTLKDATPFEYGTVFEVENPVEFDDTYLNRHDSKGFKKEDQEFRTSAFNDKYGFSKTNKKTNVLNCSYINYKLDRNTAGFIAFDVDVLEDTLIMINYDEILSPYEYELTEKFRSEPATEVDTQISKSNYLKNGASNIDVNRLHSISSIAFKLKEGRYSLQAFEPDCMQYIKFYNAYGKAIISNVRFVTYENENISVKFNSVDKDLNLIFNSAINTLRGNSVDVLTDCASRERAGWLCDSYFSGIAEKIITGKNDVEKNMIHTFIDYKPEFCPNIPKEVWAMCYPSDMDCEHKYIPNWCMWFILEVCDYIKRSGDLEVGPLLKDKFITFTEHMLEFKNEFGLLENIESWVFVEWSRANDLTNGISYPTNMLFSNVLDAMYEMYGIEKYKLISEEMKKEIVKESFNGKFFVDNAVRDKNNKLVLNTEWTETCQYYAFWCGVASKEEYPELFDIIFNEIKDYSDLSDKYPNMSRSNMFIGMYLRMDYLSRIREHKKVIENLKSFFLYQAELTGTFWEYKTSQASLCHSFASIMALWIIKAATGFEKIENDNVLLKGDGALRGFEVTIPSDDKIYVIRG